ncbi:unnamed protein product [Vitrella brassicaformis CCMP3155]|uniref:Uncharacterized protein n=1 Tax=Vitrella brassicaformis (strain CCMP3155) TaxID=1169540 RepID=A0A0G4FEU3_VITBC|nr:unnamed protein product [Vitrella brassicaformis CCMP3155]|eukprot:CEM11725.1 unnamed protein product [Vitrella brassicaformis CCMP3155]
MFNICLPQTKQARTATQGAAIWTTSPHLRSPRQPPPHIIRKERCRREKLAVALEQILIILPNDGGQLQQVEPLRFVDQAVQSDALIHNASGERSPRPTTTTP